MQNNPYDVIIIGAGPAGLTAGLYNGRARLKTLIIEGTSTPSQMLITNEIENYPGVLGPVSGFKIIEDMKKQVSGFGVEFEMTNVLAISKDNNIWKFETEDGDYSTYTVIVATGTLPRYLGVPGEKEFRGRGVSYCATCDGAFFKDKNIIVAGGGDTAVEEAIFLTRFAEKVTIVHRRDKLRALKVIQERAFANKKIDFAWDSVVVEILGEKKVSGVQIKNVKTEKISKINCDGAFVFIGYIPNVSFVADILDLDSDGYIITDDRMVTSKQGVFACGDCRNTPLRQIITACADGAIAADSALKYIETVNS